MLKYMIGVLLALSIVGTVRADTLPDVEVFPPQSNCDLTELMMERLTSEEMIKIGVGVEADGSLAELYSTVDGRQWVVAVTEVIVLEGPDPDVSVTCIITGGWYWRTMGAVGERI